MLLKHNGLHFDIQIDANDSIGKTDAARVKDVVIEAAVSTIIDCEDSVAAVDADDKVQLYRNWLGLMKGELTEEVTKGGKTFTRRLNPDREYTAPNGGTVKLHGRSLLFMRNVGHLMTNPAVLDRDGKEIPEGILDAVMTTLGSLHDLQTQAQLAHRLDLHRQAEDARPGRSRVRRRAVRRASKTCSACRATRSRWASWTRSAAPASTCKACIAAASARVAFINTGFLDRTGDEMHTAMQAGPMMRKGDMKSTAWIAAYERNNVLVGLERVAARPRADRQGHVGDARPDGRDARTEDRASEGRREHRLGALAHGRDAARAALPPGRRAGGAGRDGKIDSNSRARRTARRPADDSGRRRGEVERRRAPQELDNNAQGILGYVVRWIDQGVGCSKVPDIHNVGLMEDRATLRISSQHIANWLLHGVVTKEQVTRDVPAHGGGGRRAERRRSALQADGGRTSNIARVQGGVRAGVQGREQPSGYTEPLLHKFRLMAKKAV